ncbi:putative BRCT domain-containing protein [Helianthus annuus]|nr:putative BRCT domain-containing protein [Helianthus annuus]KAJ0639703.1 putative BRCT domain-containing protein [Helianthus annuus]KAJ0643652.1 putative BRCT domain-containing protein [Helianthus annuus]KAJ0834337.1 putative BRCT domain-containing protein [Helianthus annuus]
MSERLWIQPWLVIYVPVRDLNGIPGATSLVICLTGYQRENREDIMTMVELMGAQVSKPLIATKVAFLPNKILRAYHVYR